MGSSPSTLSAEQASELSERRQEIVDRAAQAIANSDMLLFATGAGWSADSGLAVYKDVADVAAYRDRELTYQDLCRPDLLESDPELFLGFWGGCIDDYRDTPPHAGYSTVAKWRSQLYSDDGSFFAFTSNVDAHLLRHLPETAVHECHGNGEWWQCADRACAERLERSVAEAAEAAAEEAAASGRVAASGKEPAVVGGRWRAPASFRFSVDPESRLAAEGPPRVVADRPVGSGEPHDAGAFASNWPRCVSCGGVARPNILMFHDGDWHGDDAQAARWEAWRRRVRERAAEAAEAAEPGGEARPLRVTVLEVGCGGNVTTVRQTSESLVTDVTRAGGVATLVRVNPELPLADGKGVRHRTLPLLAKGLEAIELLDAAIEAHAKARRGGGPAQRAAKLAAAADPIDGLDFETVPMAAPEPEPEYAEPEYDHPVVSGAADGAAAADAPLANGRRADGSLDVGTLLASLDSTWALFERFDSLGSRLQEATRAVGARMEAAAPAAAPSSLEAISEDD